jgi:hypothetical protein
MKKKTGNHSRVKPPDKVGNLIGRRREVGDGDSG